MIVVFHQLSRYPFKSLRFLLFAAGLSFVPYFPLSQAGGSRTTLSSSTYVSERHGRSELTGVSFTEFSWCNGLYHLFQKVRNLVQQLRAVLFQHSCARQKYNLLALDSILVPSDSTPPHRTDETFCRQGLELNWVKYIILSLLYTVTKTIDGDKNPMLIPATRYNECHAREASLVLPGTNRYLFMVGVDNYLKHHFRMIRQRPVSL